MTFTTETSEGYLQLDRLKSGETGWWFEEELIGGLLCTVVTDNSRRDFDVGEWPEIR